MHKIHTNIKKKWQAAVTFRDNDIGVLGYFCHRIFSHLAKCLFLLPKSSLNKQF
jgi:hypothetical protein